MWDILLLNAVALVLDTGFKQLRKTVFVCFRILFSRSVVSEISVLRQKLRAVFRHLLYMKQEYHSLHSYVCLFPSPTFDWDVGVNQIG
jgi:hypothetical protein